MLKKLTDLAKSEKGREFAEKATTKAKQIANDPQTREKIDAAKKKFNERVGADKSGAKADPTPTSTTGTTGEPADGKAAAEPPDSSGGGKAA
jgi:hypothetical protein